MSEIDTLGIKIEVDRGDATRQLSGFQKTVSGLTNNVGRDLQTLRNAFGTLKDVNLRNKFFPALANDAKQGAREVQQSAQRIRSEIEGIQKASSRASNLTAGFVGGLAAGAIGAAIGGLRTLRDGFTDAADSSALLTSRLTLATQGYGSLAQAQKDVRQIANETRSDLDATGRLYSTIALNAKQMGIEQAKVAQVTSTFQKTLKISGASGQEAASAILQFSQALGSGKLAGDEFRSIAEASPRFMTLLADSLGKPRGELKKLATEGKLTADVLIKAMTDPKMVAKIEQEFGKIPVTFADIRTAAKNTAVDLAGAFSRGFGIEQSLAVTAAKVQQWATSLQPTFEAIGKAMRDAFTSLTPIVSAVFGVLGPILSGIIANFGTLVNWLHVAGAAFLILQLEIQATRFTAMIAEMIALERAMGAASVMSGIFSIAIKAAQGAVNSLTLALLANPFTAIAVAIAAVVAAVVHFGNSTYEVGGKVVQGWDIVAAAWQGAVAFTKTIWESISGYVEFAARAIMAVTTGGLSEVAIAVYQNWDAIYAGTVAIWDQIKDYVIAAVRIIAAGLTFGLSEVAILVYNNWEAIYASTVSIWNQIKDYVIGAIRAIAAIATLGMSEIAIAGWNAFAPAARRAGTNAGKAYNDSLRGALDRTKPEAMTPEGKAFTEKLNASRAGTPPPPAMPKPAGGGGTKPRRGGGGGKPRDEAAEAAKKYKEALAELNYELKSVAFSEKERAYAEALGRAGLAKDPKQLGAKADAIRKVVDEIREATRLKSGDDAIKDIKQAIEDLTLSERDLAAVEAVRRAGFPTDLAGIQALTEAEKEKAKAVREGALALFDQQKAKAQREQATSSGKSLRDDLRDRGQDLKFQIQAVYDPEGAEKARRAYELSQTIAEINRLKREGADIDAEGMIRAAEQNAKMDEQLSRIERQKEMVGQMSDFLVDLWNNPKKAMKRFFQDLMKRLLEAILKAAILGEKLGGGGGVGGFIGSIFKGIFGGARATGGGVDGGKAYLVGERGPELLVPNQAGRIMPNRMLAGAGGGSVILSPTYNIQLSGNAQQDNLSLAAIRRQQQDQNAQIKRVQKAPGWTG